MDISLEKIDIVVARTNSTFKEAKEALEKTGGDVVEAIVFIEDNRGSWTGNMSNKGERMIDKIKEILKKGNVTKIIVKKDGEVIMNIPVNAAALGTIISAPLALLGLGTAILSKCVIEIQREDGKVVNIDNLIEKDEDKDSN